MRRVCKIVTACQMAFSIALCLLLFACQSSLEGAKTSNLDSTTSTSSNEISNDNTGGKGSDTESGTSQKYVYFDNGDCNSGPTGQPGFLKITINGAPHPTFPIVRGGDCLKMSDDDANQNIQVRCTCDPNEADPVNNCLDDSIPVGPGVVSGEGSNICSRLLN